MLRKVEYVVENGGENNLAEGYFHGFGNTFTLVSKGEPQVVTCAIIETKGRVIRMVPPSEFRFLTAPEELFSDPNAGEVERMLDEDLNDAEFLRSLAETIRNVPDGYVWSSYTVDCLYRLANKLEGK